MVKYTVANTFRIASYSRQNGSGEFVVILEPNEDANDYTSEGEFGIDGILTIDGDATSFPCSRELTHSI